MKGDIREYAKLGLVHHMLYPECAQSGGIHVKTLLICGYSKIQTPQDQ